MITKIKFIDLFAGIGGFHKALEIVAKNNNYDIECVFVSEIDTHAIKTYSENFSVDKNNIINIYDLDDTSSKVPNHDFLFAGFPCQTFSNAGKKKGFLDEIRGNLFFKIVKILENKKPKYFLLENVKHLVNHDNGKTWEKIIKTLKQLDYIVNDKPLILSPHEFGIPQERYRVFIPGVLRNSTNQNVKEITFELDSFKKIMKNDTVNSVKDHIFHNYLDKNIDSKYFLNKNSEKDKYLIDVFEAWNDFLMNVEKPLNRTLPVIWTFEFGRKYSIKRFPLWKQKYITNIRNLYNANKDFIDKWLKKYNVDKWHKREQKFEWHAGKDVFILKESFIQLRQSGIRCKRPIKFPTFVAMVQIPIIYDDINETWRHLSPREVAKLQSFPDDYKIYSDIGKDSQDFYSYKQFGNSVNVKIVSIIQEQMLKNY